ncbi:ATP-binding protein [Proteinivorax hydrogeniformans]|uniref:histidine kinase n=1 Tax=Proteinivorax hydrogeniformans TaxID=1826727 RepID=A0AAU8HWA1_9FIRM
MNKMRFSIRGKISVTYGILFLLIVLILGSYLSYFLGKQYKGSLEENISNNANLLSSFIESMDEGGLQSFSEETSDKLGARVTIIDIDGNPISETAKPPHYLENHIDRPEIQGAIKGRVTTEQRYSRTMATDMLYSAAPILDNDGQVIGFFRLAKPLDEIRSAISQIRFVVYVGFSVGIILVWIIGGFLAKAITKPLGVLMNKAKRAGRGNFSNIKEIYSRDEIGQLEDVFNEMGQNLGLMVEDLDKERIRLTRILDNLPVGVLVINHECRLLTSNHTARHILGYQQGEEKPYLNTLTDNYNINKFVNEIINSGKQQNTEIILGEGRDEQRYLQVMGAVVYKNEYGENEEVVIVLHDVSNLKELELMRKDLVANVSHELRTPLTAVQGFAETLLEEKLDEETQAHFIKIIKNESIRLSSLLEDLLTLSKLEGAEERKTGCCNVKGAALKVVDLLNQKIIQKKHNVNIEIDEDLNVGVYCDYIEQVLLNYVENSVKYTPDGTDIKISALKEDNNFIRLIVRDNGSGIPLKDQKRVFERFFRVDRSRESQLGGTGLGLSIVKHIVEGFGGEVGLISNKDGTSFWATLPKQKEVC